MRAMETTQKTKALEAVEQAFAWGRRSYSPDRHPEEERFNEFLSKSLALAGSESVYQRALAGTVFYELLRRDKVQFGLSDECCSALASGCLGRAEVVLRALIEGGFIEGLEDGKLVLSAAVKVIVDHLERAAAEAETRKTPGDLVNDLLRAGNTEEWLNPETDDPETRSARELVELVGEVFVGDGLIFARAMSAELVTLITRSQCVHAGEDTPEGYEARLTNAFDRGRELLELGVKHGIIRNDGESLLLPLVMADVVLHQVTDTPDEAVARSGE